MPKRLAEVDALSRYRKSSVPARSSLLKTSGCLARRSSTSKTQTMPRKEPASGARVAKSSRLTAWNGSTSRIITAMNALVNGEVDLWETPAVDMVPLLKTNADIEIKVIDPLGTQGWLRPNHLHPPFDNPKARQALLYAVNQEEYLQAIVGDPALYKVCAAYFICGTPTD